MPMVGQLWVTGAYGGANELYVPMMFQCELKSVNQKFVVSVNGGV